MITLAKERLASGGWFHLNDENMHLMTFLEKPKTALEAFLNDAGTLLKPFSLGSYFFVFIVIPMLVFLKFYHEYGTLIGFFPQNERQNYFLNATNHATPHPNRSQDVMNRY